MYSPSWVNQFEIKDACIEFVINVLAKGNNNVKLKLNVIVKKICSDCNPIFCEINDNAPGFLFSLIRYIDNPVKHLI